MRLENGVYERYRDWFEDGSCANGWDSEGRVFYAARVLPMTRI